MSWYDLFSRFYDRSLEPLYVEARTAAAEALRLEPGLTVLDVPVGTGQSLDVLAPAVLPGGHVLGVDASAIDPDAPKPTNTPTSAITTDIDVTEVAA